MKKFMSKFEDLWVAVAFAEAGMYEPAVVQDLQPHCEEALGIYTV